jgi:Ran GTPase-activating protein (RanGAP) involved in mRNA processing and transport
MSLEHMRANLARTGMLAEFPGEVLEAVLRHTPNENGLVAQVSRGVRRHMASSDPPSPLNFRLLLGQYPELPQHRRRSRMLTALEAQGRLHRLEGIAVPDFELDGPGPAGWAYERGVVRLAAVVGQHGAWLRELDVAGTSILQWRELDAALPACVALQRVKLSDSVFGPANHPFAGLAQCHALRELLLNDCDMDREVAALAPVLANCQRLEKLDLGRNSLWFTPVQVGPGAPLYGLEHVTNALLHHLSLRDLGLSKCGLNAACFAALAACLPTLLALERLDVSVNLINGVKMAPLAAALAQCLALRHLSLHSSPELNNYCLNLLLHSGCVRRLESLDVSSCGLHCHNADAAAAFAAELALSPELRELNLSRNRLGDAFAALLAQTLPATRLESLDLAEGALSDGCGPALATALAAWPGLQQLRLAGNAFSGAMQARLRAAWRQSHAGDGGLWM